MLTFPKPARGTAYLEGRTRRAARRNAEQSVMRAAKKRDGGKCRRPGCKGTFEGLRLPIDACHGVHRGAGGNPDGSRTAETRQIISLCRWHHSRWDAHLMRIDPLTDAGFDGPCAFYDRDEETGEFKHAASESRAR